MTEKKPAGCEPAGAALGFGQNPVTRDKYIISFPEKFVNTHERPRHIDDLARQAAAKAEWAGMLVEAFHLAGDRAAFWQARRHLLLHQAVYWTATRLFAHEVRA